ncbi:MAG TPA: DnaJ C-terminal domain-containing protein [Azospira sp.]|nr:DnaJ C-terminal domain-containing protein [Azospira sp.]
MTSSQRDYYEILGVARDAGQKEIKDAFRDLAMKYHPDRNKEPGAEARFKEIAEAYAVLSDPKKRAGYDNQGFAGVAGFSSEDLFGGINFEDIFGDSGFGLGGGLFDRIFHRRAAGPPRGGNIEIDLEIPLAKVVAGGDETLRLQHPRACPECGGNGAASGSAPRECAECHGSGRKTVSQQRRDSGSQVLIQQIGICPACQGRGRIIEHPCLRCHGQGQIEEEETLTVNIPIGVEEGMALRVPGHGRPSPVPGGPPGDLFVVVRSAPDAHFQRNGADLWYAARIGPVDAVLGTELEVPTLEGSVKVSVPPGSQPDATLRLRGKGLPEFGGKQRGDLYLRLHLHIPEKISAEARALYEKLRTLPPGSR